MRLPKDTAKLVVDRLLPTPWPKRALEDTCVMFFVPEVCLSEPHHGLDHLSTCYTAVPKLARVPGHVPEISTVLPEFCPGWLIAQEHEEVVEPGFWAADLLPIWITLTLASRVDSQTEARRWLRGRCQLGPSRVKVQRTVLGAKKR
jgi:hypothetical protein